MTKIRKLLIPDYQTKPKGVKALDDCFLMLVFTLLLNYVRVFAIFIFHLDRAEHAGSERVKKEIK